MRGGGILVSLQECQNLQHSGHKTSNSQHEIRIAFFNVERNYVLHLSTWESDNFAILNYLGVLWLHKCNGNWSAYEVKKNCCLFERLFKVKKNGLSLLGISFFVLEKFTFLYYANEESDDVIGGSIWTVKRRIKNISRNIGAVFFKLGTKNVHYKRNRKTRSVVFPWQHHRCGLFMWKTKYANLQPFEKGQRVLFGTHMIPILT